MINLSCGSRLKPGLNIIKTVLPRHACLLGWWWVFNTQECNIVVSFVYSILKAFVDDELAPSFALSAAPWIWLIHRFQWCTALNEDWKIYNGCYSNYINSDYGNSVWKDSNEGGLGLVSHRYIDSVASYWAYIYFYFPILTVRIYVKCIPFSIDSVASS